MKILVADCGATKADWYVSGGVHIRTEGINMVHTPLPRIKEILSEVAEKLGPGIEEVHFYAAGAIGEPPVDFGEWFPGAGVEYASDIYAAARAVCGRNPGIAAIVGTGANTCQWDGEKITRQFRPGGHILGDEGSAAVLGKRFLADYIKGLVPDTLAESFRQQFPQEYGAIMEAVYKGAAPARFLGSLAPFVMGHYEEDEYARELADDNFRDFFRRTVIRYDALPLGVVGGFGYACRDILTRIGEKEFGIRFSTILPSPLEGLKKYYGL